MCVNVEYVPAALEVISVTLCDDNASLCLVHCFFVVLLCIAIL